MVDKESKKVADVYRKLLDPMGYTVILKPRPEDKKEWEPENKEIYQDKEGKIISSIELERKIQDLKVQETNIQKVMEDIRVEAINFMNTQPPNDETANLYTGTYAKNAINKAAVRVNSKKLDNVTRLKEYLIGLKRQKIREEMLAEIQKNSNRIVDMRVKKEMTGAILQVTIE